VTTRFAQHWPIVITILDSYGSTPPGKWASLRGMKCVVGDDLGFIEGPPIPLLHQSYLLLDQRE
jgi:hypothetical protein